MTNKHSFWSIFTAYACRSGARASAIWRNASERGNGSKRGGGGAERHLGVSLSGHLARTRPTTYRPEAREARDSEIRTDDSHQKTGDQKADHTDKRSEISYERDIQGFHFERQLTSDHMQTTG